jgi:N-acetyltransferase
MGWPDPLTLAGRFATLRPLAASHHDGLCEAARDGELWRLWYTAIPSPEGMAQEIERRLGLQARGSMLPFTVFDAGDSGSVGSSGRGIPRAADLDAATQRTALNTQCKRLLLGHAFDKLGCIAVEFRTHRLNTQSRRAIERLGAQLDGILRAHMVMPNGSVRDTAVYSITAAEWPTVRAHLDWQLARPR